MKMKIIATLTGCLMACSLSAQDVEDVIINPIEVKDNFHVLFGAGGNIGLLIGDDGALMIDDQFAPLAPKIMTVVDSLSQTKLTYLINTHWHGDHTGGNAAFAAEGATIIAHDNVRARLSTDQVRPFGRTTTAAPEIALPKLTFSENMSLYFNGQQIQLIHHHNAHTDGDAFVYFPQLNIIHLGDVFFHNRFPFVDVVMGGSPEGLIAAVEAALMIVDEDTFIIPGHGGIASKQNLTDYHQMLLIMRGRIKAEIEKGTAESDLDIDTLTKGFTAWGEGFINGEKFVKMLFRFYSEE